MAPRLLVFLVGIACGQPAADGPSPSPSSTGGAAAPAAKPHATDVAGLKAALDAGDAVVIDVRTPDEFASGHVPGAVNIPLDQVESRLAELEPHRERPVHLVCAVGGRSSKATDLLAKAGFSQAINVDGGTRGWIAAGYPVE